MKTMKSARLTLVSILLATGTGCASQSLEAQDVPPVDERPALPFPPGVSLESVCGLVDDLQHVELYDGTLGVTEAYVAAHEQSTVQFQWKSRNEIRAKLGASSDAGNVGDHRWCSGTLFRQTDPATGQRISYVLTAAHCFESQASGWFTPQVGGNLLTPAQNARLMVVNMNYQVNGATGVVREAAEYEVHSLPETGLGGLDYAIVRLGAFRDGEAAYRPSYAELDAREMQHNESLAIIQHPQGDPKKIEAGSLIATSGSDAYYGNIDTHGGSSGSGVRDGDGRIIAVHTNGGCSHNGGANRGVLLRAISDVSPML